MPVLLSGGTGTRLWPLSREAYPKQLLPLASDRTMLQETARRVEDRSTFMAPVVIANAEHRFVIAEQLRGLGIEDATIVLEPVGRNTAPAAATAALIAVNEDPDAIILLMPADHVVSDPKAFLNAVETGVAAADAGKLVLFAVTAAFTIIVVAVPEGLPLAVTLALSYTTRRMAAESILVRELPACETMGAGTIICTDKTGTLTRGQMSLAHVWIGGELHDTDQIQASSLTGLTSIAKGFAVNSSADLAVEPDGSIRVIGNATEGGILQWLATSGTDYRIARESAVVVERRQLRRREHELYLARLTCRQMDALEALQMPDRHRVLRGDVAHV